VSDFSFESEYIGLVAGVDEAGRGPLAGPVAAAAVILDRDDFLDGINDSKKLSAKKREFLYAEIMKVAQVGVAVIGREIIDDINILQATKLAMKQAVENLSTYPDMVFVDGNQSIDIKCNHKTIVKGDSKSLSIAAASIVAKVTRDRIMAKLHNEFPQYGWGNNSGYGTKEHIAAINKYGVTTYHRKSFAPVRNMLRSELESCDVL